MEIISMSALRPGEGGIVTETAPQGEMRRRMRDIGLIPGTTVECIGRSPLGDPAAFRICGTVIALRCTDCERVLVRR